MLVLVRHGQSAWNKLNQFTGWRDVPLTDTGRAEADAAGRFLKEEGLSFDAAYTSDLMRAQDTLAHILKELDQEDIPVTRAQELKERDYGALSGMNKDEARAKFGEEQVHIWRRSYDIQPPEGESLKDVYGRVVPYFEAEILPKLKNGETILIAAHGNSLRALVKNLEGISDEDISDLNIATGAPIVYEFDEAGVLKQIKSLSKDS